MTISATFDSNVWRKVVSPHKFPKDPQHKIYNSLHGSVLKKQLKGFLSETMFNLETVPRGQRKDYFGRYEAKHSMEFKGSKPDGTIHMRLSISPDTSNHPRNSEFHSEHLQDALALDFKLLSAPRTALPRNPDLLSSYFPECTEEEFRRRYDLYGDACEFITSLNCGYITAVELGKKYKSPSERWLNGLLRVDDHDKHLIPKAIAEWADEDSIAAHISYGIDYFCTLDQAAKAGEASVFSEHNRKALSKRFGVRFVTPEELSQSVC